MKHLEFFLREHAAHPATTPRFGLKVHLLLYLEQTLLNLWQRRAWAWVLWPLTLPYRMIVTLRRGCFKMGWCRATHLPVPLIVVGNLIVGGAGKTPVVLALLERLRQQGWQAGVISRGYARAHSGVFEVTANSPPQQVGDEPLLIARRGQVPVIVGRDRVRAAQHLLHHHPNINIIVSDDGLQHLALAPDIQIIVFDERGAGNGFMLPAGPLREPLPRQCPARSLVLYNAAQASTPLPGHFGHRRLIGLVSLTAWHEGHKATPNTLEQLAQHSQHAPVFAAAGIAQPERFFTSLRLVGLKITPVALPDHYDFSGPIPWPLHAAHVIITEKDAVKLSGGNYGLTQIWVAPLDFCLDSSFIDALELLMPAPFLTPPHGHPFA